MGVKNVWITEKFNLEQTLGPFLLIRLTRDACGLLIIPRCFSLSFLPVSFYNKAINMLCVLLQHEALGHGNNVTRHGLYKSWAVGGVGSGCGDNF